VGDLIMYVDSDDKIALDALQYVNDVFSQNSSALHSSIYYYGDIVEPVLYSSESILRKHLFGKLNALSCGPGARVFRRDFITSLGGFPEKYGPANDMYFNLKSTSLAPILFFPYNYLFYRLHSFQESKNKKAYILQNYRYFNDAFNELQLPFSELEKRLLLKKNKRRFLINSFKYSVNECRLMNFYYFLKDAGFSIKDIFEAVFN
jgi:hypothetical protein